jgi:hypothetical protein
MFGFALKPKKEEVSQSVMRPLRTAGLLVIAVRSSSFCISSAIVIKNLSHQL